MLTIPKRALLAATLTATILVAAGLVMASMLTPAGLDHQAGTANLIAQGGGDCGDRNCDVWDDDPGGDGDNGGESPGGGGGGGDGACYFGGGGGGPITVSDHRGQAASVILTAQGRTEVPCFLEGYGFYGGDGCYYGDFPSIRPIPPPPEGKTEEDGRYYYLSCLASANPLTFYLSERWVWVDNADVPTVTPEQVARAWLASITLDGVSLQIAPPPDSGAGLVGLPVWLGVDTSDTNSWGGISDSHCISGVCVSISAQVTSVDWNMGDGTTFTCSRDEHRSWQRGMDFRSPTGCHHYYQRASRHQPGGRYPITATSHWLVEWSATSASGTLTTERTATTSIQIDEIQVLTTR